MSAYTSNSCFDAGYSKLLLVKTITAAFWIFSLCKAGKNKIDLRCPMLYLNVDPHTNVCFKIFVAKFYLN